MNGLQIEIETEPYREGGVNDFVHIFPKGIKYQPLVLKRGITDPRLILWNGTKSSEDMGKLPRKNVTVSFDGLKLGHDKRALEFQGAYPIKWTGPELKADSNTIAIESIELVHQGIIDSK